MSPFAPLLAAVLMSLPGACAQILTPSASTGIPTAVDRSETVFAGDQLTLNVNDLDEVHNVTARIASDGNLDLPLVGLVHVDGMTITQLRSTLVAHYSKFVRDPQVSVQVVNSQSRTVSVIGEVNAPSVQEITGSLTLVSAITKAGGVRPEAGSKVIVTRDARSGKLPLANATESSDGHSTATLSLDDLLSSKTPEKNILLQAGDVVSIPKGNLVYVIGNVHKPGGFHLRPSGSISLIEALALAEGLAPNARSQDAKILRPISPTSESRKEIPINIAQVMEGKQADPMLFPDDILYVPNSAVKSSARRTAEAILQVTTGILIYR